MVFSLIDLQTLLRLDWWYERLGEHNHAETPRMFIGAKNDLVEKLLREIINIRPRTPKRNAYN